MNRTADRWNAGGVVAMVRSMNVYDWMVAGKWRLAVTFAIAVGALLAGLYVRHDLDARAADRVANGLPAQAQVTAVGGFSIGRAEAQEVTISYSVGGHPHSARLMSITTASGSFRKGQTIDIYVDRSDPGMAATADRFVSEDRLVEIPYALIALAIILFIFLIVGLIRRRGPATRASAR
jgi:uncharacterized protein DUF3592